eukprot:1335188-Rhodomonas_salina.2
MSRRRRVGSGSANPLHALISLSAHQTALPDAAAHDTFCRRRLHHPEPGNTARAQPRVQEAAAAAAAS